MTDHTEGLVDKKNPNAAIPGGAVLPQENDGEKGSDAALNTE
jgi:hypothetical protein